MTRFINADELIKYIPPEESLSIFAVANALAVNVVPVVHGKWLWELADNGWADHICSVCGFTKNTDIHVRVGWRYCPNCGARMDAERKENE